MISSGTTALATSGDAAIELLAASSVQFCNFVTIINESAVAGFFSLDGGTTWARWADTAKAMTLQVPLRNQAVQFKRIASGTNVTGLWAWAV